jgi:hypothetical protein
MQIEERKAIAAREFNAAKCEGSAGLWVGMAQAMAARRISLERTQGHDHREVFFNVQSMAPVRFSIILMGKHNLCCLVPTHDSHACRFKIFFSWMKTSG